MSENKYRGYLSDDGFHRRYLKNEDEPVGSSFFTKAVTTAGAAVGVAAAATAAYRKGHMREPIMALIDQLAKIRETRAGAVLDGVRNWADNDVWDDFRKLGFKDRISAQMSYTKQLGKSVEDSLLNYQKSLSANKGRDIMDETPGILKLIQQYNAVGDARRKLINDPMTPVAERLKMQSQLRAELGLMEKHIDASFNATKDQQKAMLERTGYKMATLGDIEHQLTKDQQALLKQAKAMQASGRLKYDVTQKIADTDIFVRETGELADLRGFKNLMQNTMNSLAQDFTMPFVRINPIRMFYLNEFTRRDAKPAFTMLRSNTRQPWITGDNGELGKDMLYVGGDIYDLSSFDKATNTFQKVAENTYLLDATGKNSPLTRLSRNMAGITISNYADIPKDAGFVRRAWYKMSRALDIGFQDEPIKENMELSDPASLAAPIASKLHNWFKPYTAFSRVDLDQAFGADADWLVMNSYKSTKQFDSVKDYFSQFHANRYNPENVTTASFFFYGFAERLNATLNQVGLGLSNANLGSAPEILSNLIMRRVAPVFLAVEGFKATNHAFELFFGDEYEDKMAGFFAASDIKMAEIRESLGMDKAFETLGQLTPGHEFLTELPIPVMTTEGLTPIQIKDLPLLGHLDMGAQELKDWYANGEEAIRKGRYWEFGNTPYTGGKVDYYQPNWFRRITSDWEYSENTYGSKGEYWLFHPKMPILDPYHWERKHYEDRPYQQTGGMPIIEDFPLIGPFLNATIGQVIKPTHMMHSAEQQGGSNYLAGLEGWQLAGEYGLIGGGSSGGGESSAGAGTSSGGLGLAGGDGSTGTGGSGGTGDLIAYSTASGATRAMNKTAGISIEDLNWQIKEAGIAKTGAAKDFRFSGGMPIASELTNDPMQHAAFANFAYNVTEMGGYYGWQAGMATDINAMQYQPRIETSRRAYGFQRSFWDQDLGNLGADANEIFRRFLPRDAHKNYINTLDNNMPTWLPGPEYFTDYQHGDPYVKLKKGEMRLPGEAYEKLYGIDSDKITNLDIGASLIGYDKEKMINHWAHRDDVRDTEMMDAGTAMHKTLERDFASRGISLSSEQWVEDKNMHIGGFYDVLADTEKLVEWAAENGADITYYSAGLGGGHNDYEGYYNNGVKISYEQAAYLAQMAPTTTGDFKTRSQRQFDIGKMHFENAQQINFYGSQLGTNLNTIIEVNRDDPNAAPKIFMFDTNPMLLDYTYGRVNEARGDMRRMLADGAIGRGDLYDPIDRYRILADTAPYSDQYRQMKSQLSKMNLTEDEKKEIQEINDQVSSRKERVRTYDYRFKYSDVTTMDVTVTKVIDNNTFLTKEMPDNPIKLAGVYVPTGKDDPIAAKARSMISDYIRPGAHVKIKVAADETRRVNNDTYATISASVGDLNRKLIHSGLAKEKKDDYSAPSVHARFTSGQIAFGKLWEEFAHMDTPIHTKLLQVRSPLEQYQRREVYGKDWQDWATPVQDFIVPWYQNMISHTPAYAMGLGAFMGANFGANRYGRVIGAIFGAVAAGLGAGAVTGFEGLTGKAWIPERRQKEREIEEYVDVLKYVKYNALYEKTAKLAKQREGFNIDNYLDGNQNLGGWRKQRMHALQEAKRKIKDAATPAQLRTAEREAKKLLGPGVYPDAMKALNAEINRLQNSRKAVPLTPLAAQAIMYKEAAAKTMYGYKQGDPMQNILSALPRKEREYLSKFMNAPKQERAEILKIVPDYVRPVLQSMWGLPVDKKPSLQEYFSKHELPDADWVGWDPRANLDDIKIKLVQKSGLDEGEFNIWPEDERRAAKIRDNVAPRADLHTKINTVKKRLRDILGGAGIEDLNVEVFGTPTPGIDVDMDIRKDRRSEFVREMNNNGAALM